MRQARNAQSDAVDVLKQLGADPVNMPMSEVYSALAKGVIDGVVAPADTIKSLHFSEVAKHFTSIRFSRGAYPARAVSDQAWRRFGAAVTIVESGSRLAEREDEEVSAELRGALEAEGVAVRCGNS